MTQKRTGRRSAGYRRGGLASLLIIIATCDTASAENAEGFYVAAGAVVSFLETDGFVEQLRPNELQTEDFGSERSGGWRVAGGYRFSRYLGVEGGFADFGDKTLSADTLFTHSLSTGSFYQDTRISMRGPYLALVGSLPIGRWDPFLKIGALRTDTSTTTQIVRRAVSTRDIILGRSSQAASAKTTELLVGIGVAYSITDHYGVALEATRVPKVGDADVTGADDLTLLSLSAQYSF